MVVPSLQVHLSSTNCEAVAGLHGLLGEILDISVIVLHQLLQARLDLLSDHSGVQQGGQALQLLCHIELDVGDLQGQEMGC